MKPKRGRAQRSVVVVRVFLGSLFVWLLATTAPRAGAHEPFDVSSRLTVFADRMELVSTLGTDGMRQLLAGAGLGAEQIAEALKPRGPESPNDHPTAVGDRFFQLRKNGEALPVKKVTSRSEGAEIILMLRFDRPGAGPLEARATGYETIPSLRKGVLIADDETEGDLGAALLSPASPTLAVTLPARPTAVPAAMSAPVVAMPAEAPARPSFGDYFKLGVHHILVGVDHLLFLAALLIGVRKTRSMLGIITCFTLAHSVTLALAALEVVTVSPRVVEPLIAASIIVVCVMNLFRKEAEGDRVWLAGGFGLLHGFGFAGALRDTGLGRGGDAIAEPLLAFNLGVEAGQLLVAAVFLPALFAIRRWPAWPRVGAPVVSSAVIAVSAFWLWQRVFLG